MSRKKLSADHFRRLCDMYEELGVTQFSRLIYEILDDDTELVSCLFKHVKTQGSGPKFSHYLEYVS